MKTIETSRLNSSTLFFQPIYEENDLVKPFESPTHNLGLEYIPCDKLTNLVLIPYLVNL